MFSILNIQTDTHKCIFNLLNADYIFLYRKLYESSGNSVLGILVSPKQNCSRVPCMKHRRGKCCQTVADFSSRPYDESQSHAAACSSIHASIHKYATAQNYPNVQHSFPKMCDIVTKFYLLICVHGHEHILCTFCSPFSYHSARLSN